MRILWSPLARARALEAVSWIEKDRPIVALDWLNALLERIDLLTELPDQGREVPEWGDPAVREVFHDPYRIIYEVFEDRIEILTLSHQRQQLGPRSRGRRGGSS